MAAQVFKSTSQKWDSRIKITIVTFNLKILLFQFLIQVDDD